MERPTRSPTCWSRRLMRHRPKAVVVGPFSRVSRSGLYFSTLLRAFNDTRAVLESNEETIDFKRPDAESRFFRLCERSAEDRRTLVMRLRRVTATPGMPTSGSSFGGERLPLGYRKPTTGRGLDSNIRVQVVREVLGDAGGSAGDCVPGRQAHRCVRCVHRAAPPASRG